MKYSKTVTLKDGRTCIIRNGTAEDGEALLELFIAVHAQTDYLLTYPDEHGYTAAQEADFLQKKTDSADEIELMAELDGKLVGSAGISCVGRKKSRQNDGQGDKLEIIHYPKNVFNICFFVLVRRRRMAFSLI